MTKQEAMKDVYRTKLDVFDALEFYTNNGAPISDVERAYDNYIIASNNLKLLYVSKGRSNE